jgi:hypothetical protein
MSGWGTKRYTDIFLALASKRKVFRSGELRTVAKVQELPDFSCQHQHLGTRTYKGGKDKNELEFSREETSDLITLGAWKLEECLGPEIITKTHTRKDIPQNVGDVSSRHDSIRTLPHCFVREQSGDDVRARGSKMLQRSKFLVTTGVGLRRAILGGFKLGAFNRNLHVNPHICLLFILVGVGHLAAKKQSFAIGYSAQAVHGIAGSVTSQDNLESLVRIAHLVGAGRLKRTSVPGPMRHLLKNVCIFSSNKVWWLEYSVGGG